MKNFKKLSDKQKKSIGHEVKLMLAAHRDSLWKDWVTCATPQTVDPNQWELVVNEGFYGEAFGIMRGLIALGFGYFGRSNLDAIQEGRSDIPEHNLKWWFHRIVQEYLDEEGFYNKSCSPEQCSQLLNKYQQLVRQ